MYHQIFMISKFDIQLVFTNETPANFLKNKSGFTSANVCWRRE